MKTKEAIVTFRGTRAENTLLKFGFGALILINGALVLQNMGRTSEVILVPPFQNETIEFTEGKANQEYYQQWAWSTAMLVGNISPGNAKFIRDELERMSTPGLFRDLNEIVELELASIVRDKAAVTFSPRNIIYDPNLDLFFVTGTQELMGPGVQSAIRKDITYEMGFTTQRLRIFLNRFDVYEGAPRTKDVREDRLAEEEAKRAAAEREANL